MYRPPSLGQHWMMGKMSRRGSSRMMTSLQGPSFTRFGKALARAFNFGRGRVHPPLGAEGVDQDGKGRALDALEEERGAAGLGHPVGNLGDLQDRINGRGNPLEYPLAFKDLEKLPKIPIRHRRCLLLAWCPCWFVCKQLTRHHYIREPRAKQGIYHPRTLLHPWTFPCLTPLARQRILRTSCTAVARERRGQGACVTRVNRRWRGW